MSSIIPSIHFRVLSVHKMQSTSCWRRYYYERVLNLQTNKIIMPFWYGGVLHVGWQSLLLGYDYQETVTAMNKENVRRQRGSIITAEVRQEMTLQFEIIKALVFTGFETCHTNWRPDKIQMEWAEEQVAWPVPGFPKVQFCSSIDMGGRVRGKKSIMEIKSAKSVSNDYFGALEFDAQPCSYMLGHRKSRNNGARKCIYMVFRKPQLKIKRGQTIDEFIDQVKKDLADITAKKNGPTFYFISKTIPIGDNAIRHAQDDIVTTTEILSDRYEKLTKRDTLLDAREWPKQTKECFYYNKGCPYTMICRHGGDVSTFLPMFKQREMLYDQEKEELAK